MTGLEPHPIFRLPTQGEARALGRERCEKILQERVNRMRQEVEDPFHFGFEPEIWHVVDDLLVDGNVVVLDLTRLAKISADGKTVPLIVDVPKEMMGTLEVWVGGSNRSSKSEYAGKKLMKILVEIEGARTWSFADTGPISAARQQPLFWRYLPFEIKRRAEATGKFKQGGVANISRTQKGGFTEDTFVLPNRAQHWFKNYEQHTTKVEGDQLDAIWFDELRNVNLLKTMRGRTIDRGGLIIVTFTSVDENYSSVVNEYDTGSRTILEVDAELLPIKKPKRVAHETHEKNETQKLKQENRNLSVPVLAEPETHDVLCEDVSRVGEARESTTPLEGRPSAKKDSRGAQNLSVADETAAATEDEEFEIVGYEKVPRLKVAGPGSDGNQRANIVYFHITDNPFFGFESSTKRTKAGQAPPLYGKERFYEAYRKATREKILSRVYGILTRSSGVKFPEFSEGVHVIEPGQVPRLGTNYHVVDPCDGRNWFMLWVRIDPRVVVLPNGKEKHRWFIWQEWPSYSTPDLTNSSPSAYIPGVGNPGPWAVPGEPADGVRGTAQNPFGFGLSRYKEEILRCEGHGPSSEFEPNPVPVRQDRPGYFIRREVRNPKFQIPNIDFVEVVSRYMDSRYGATPSTTKEGQTTLIEQMDEIGMMFLAASGKDIAEGTELIHELLDYDKEVELGKYSPRLGRINEPLVKISRNCPNLITALKGWTGIDKGHGAMKDPIDVFRYGVLADFDYIGEESFAFVGGGHY